MRWLGDETEGNLFWQQENISQDGKIPGENMSTFSVVTKKTIKWDMNILMRSQR